MSAPLPASITRWIIPAACFGGVWMMFGLLPGLIVGAFAGLIAVFSAADPALLEARQAISAALGDAGLEVDGTQTRFAVRLAAGIPPINSLYPGEGGLITGDAAFDRAVCLIANSASWLPLLSAPVRAHFVAIQPARADSAARTIVIEALTVEDHRDLVVRVERARALNAALADEVARPRAELMRQRLDEADSPDARLVAFKSLWHADRRAAGVLAASLEGEAQIRYFVATASTPPDRALIEAYAFDPRIDGAVRTAAGLRWLGLEHDLYARDRLIEAMRDRAHPLAETFARLIELWAASVADSSEALTLLGEVGQPRHAAVIGAQRNGPHAADAQAALARLRDRFPGLQGGHLAIANAGAGQLGLVDEAGGLSPADDEPPPERS